MSITEDELSKLIPYTDNNQAISVGFNTADSVREIKQMLLSILNPKFAKDEKNSEDIKKTNEKINHSLIENALAQRKSIEKNNEYIKKLQSVSDETRKAIEELKGYGISFLDIATKAFTNYMQDTLKLSNVFRDIESSGVLVNGGFKSLGSTASSLGMTYEELAGQLKKSAPLIAKLNSSYKDGVDIFRKSIKNISDDYNLTHDEQVAAFNAALEDLAPSQLRQMSEQQLIATVDETAKQMKLLSLAIGKSIENIKQENDLKAQSIRVQAWKRNNKLQSQILTQLGLDSPEMIDYLLSGGTRINGELFTKIAGDSYLQAALPDIMRMLQTGQLNTQGIGYLQQQYGNIAQQRINEVNANTNNRALFAGSSASQYMENMAYYDEASRKLLEIDQKRLNELLKSEERLQDSNLLSNLTNYGESARSRDTELLRAKTGGPEGMTKALSIGSIANNAISGTVGWLNDMLDKAGLSGMTSGMAASAIGTAGSSLFTYAVHRFSKAVDKFVGGSSFNSGLLESLTSSKSKTGRFIRNANKFATSIPFLGNKISTPLRGFGTGLVTTGLGMATDKISNSLVENGIIEQDGGVDRGMGYLSSILGNAGTGAMIGSMFGPIGTLVGGGIGALVGGISQYMENSKKDQAQIKASEYSQINTNSLMSKPKSEAESIMLNQQNEMITILRDIRGDTLSSATTAQLSRYDYRLNGNKTNGSNMNEK